MIEKAEAPAQVPSAKKHASAQLSPGMIKRQTV